MHLPEEAVVCVEPWAYGTDGMHDMAKRIVMCYFYLRLSSHRDANHHAYPLDLCAEMCDNKVIDVYRLPSGETERISRDSVNGKSTVPANTILSWLESRSATKPYQIIQPEGSSFKTQGNILTWESGVYMWVSITGKERSSMISVMMAVVCSTAYLYLELFIPYGDPRTPYNRKTAFNLGNNGRRVHQ